MEQEPYQKLFADFSKFTEKSFSEVTDEKAKMALSEVQKLLEKAETSSDKLMLLCGILAEIRYNDRTSMRELGAFTMLMAQLVHQSVADKKPLVMTFTADQASTLLDALCVLVAGLNCAHFKGGRVSTDESQPDTSSSPPPR